MGSGTFQSDIVVQFSSVRTDHPDNWGSALQNTNQQGAGSLNGKVSISGADKWWVRFGVAYSLTTGSNVTQADVGLQIVFRQKGRTVATRSLTLVAEDTDSVYVPISDWMPSYLVDKAKATFITTGATNANQRIRMVHRTAPTTTTSESGWTTTNLNPTPSWYSGNGERNTGEIAFTSEPTDFWLQYGVETNLSSAGSTGSCQLIVCLATRWS